MTDTLTAWAQIDWTIAFPVSGLADGFPPLFKPSASSCLRELPLGDYAPFEPFADRLITQNGLTWPSQDQTNVNSIMRSIIKRVVVDIMDCLASWSAASMLQKLAMDISIKSW